MHFPQSLNGQAGEWGESSFAAPTDNEVFVAGWQYSSSYCACRTLVWSWFAGGPVCLDAAQFALVRSIPVGPRAHAEAFCPRRRGRWMIPALTRNSSFARNLLHKCDVAVFERESCGLVSLRSCTPDSWHRRLGLAARSPRKA